MPDIGLPAWMVWALLSAAFRADGDLRQGGRRQH
jgi:hypothetical protein